VAKLGATDAAAAEQLSAALASSGAGRARMDEVIAAAVADVESLGLSTGTPAGKQALVAAIERRLHETRATVDGGTADAGTQAAAADVNAAGYNGLANPAAPPMGGPAAGMPMGGGMPGGMPMPSMPSMPMGGMSALSSLPATALQGLSSLAGGAKTSDPQGSGLWGADAERAGGDESQPGRADEKGLQKYTILMNRAVSAAFPEITTIGGVRPDALKWHPNGLALDIMIPHWDTPQGKALGDRVVQFLLTNKERLGLAHMIWRQHMIEPSGASTLMENRGSPNNNHFNHVHAVSIGGGL
jgi:hypothetical protein